MKSILFVCTGNICRSPSAEAILRQMASRTNLSLTIESAGTGAWHKGEPMDARAASAAQARAYETTGIRSRPVNQDDFNRFDLIYAMAKEHQRWLLQQSPSSADKIFLFLKYTTGRDDDVPDPYYGGDAGFEKMMDMLEQGCASIIEKLAGMEI